VANQEAEPTRPSGPTMPGGIFHGAARVPILPVEWQSIRSYLDELSMRPRPINEVTPIKSALPDEGISAGAQKT
jgi:hypothetical protein